MLPIQQQLPRFHFDQLHNDVTKIYIDGIGSIDQLEDMFSSLL